MKYIVLLVLVVSSFFGYKLYIKEVDNSFPKLNSFFSGHLDINQIKYPIIIDANKIDNYRITIFNNNEFKIQDIRFESNSYLPIKLNDQRFLLEGKCTEKNCVGKILDEHGVVGTWQIQKNKLEEKVILDNTEIELWQNQVNQYRVSENELTAKQEQFSNLKAEYIDYEEIINIGKDLKINSTSKEQDYETQINQINILIDSEKNNIDKIFNELQKKILNSKAGILYNKSVEYLELSSLKEPAAQEKIVVDNNKEMPKKIEPQRFEEQP